MPTKSKHGATRKAEHKSYSHWIIIGLLSIALFTFLFILNATSTSEKETASAKTVEQKESESFPYTFYNDLPSRKVENVISEEPIPSKKILDSLSKPQSMELYQLQVGAFNELKKADAMKANLALTGVISNIYVLINKGQKIHRVRVGPSTDLQKIEQIQAQLKANNYTSFIQKL